LTGANSLDVGANGTQAGTVVLAGADTYAGPTQVSGGTLELGASASLPGGTAATVNGTLDINAFDAMVSALTGMGTVNHSGAGSNNLSVGSGAFGGTIDNTHGMLALVKSGSGQLVLSGSDSFTGGTFVTAGKLIVTNPSAFPAGTSLTVGAGAILIFDPSQAASSVSVAVPEPATLALLMVGAIGLLSVAGRRKRSREASAASKEARLSATLSAQRQA